MQKSEISDVQFILEQTEKRKLVVLPMSVLNSLNCKVTMKKLMFGVSE